jgi:iduronate 2-sulfatase
MKIRIIVIFFAMCLAILACNRNKVQELEKPNILFIIADDLADRLSCTGDSLAVTPNLDKLAERGVMFTNSFCQYPSCGPSRSSMLTGLYPWENGHITNSPKMFNEEVPGIISLPRLFRDNGYFTARVGKIFHMGIPGGIGGPGGDDTLAWDVTVNNTGYDASLEVWENATHVGSEIGPGARVVYAAPEIDDEEMADGQGLKAAIGLLKEHNSKKTGKPFFLAYGIYRPHPPMIVPKKHWDAIDMSSYQLPFVPQNDRDDIPEGTFHLLGPGFNFIPESHAKNYTQAYYAAIHFVDDLAGELIRELDREGLADNTIIVFTGDQGFHLGEHGHWHKTSMFEEAFKVPLIIVDPRQREKGKTCTNLAGLVDLYPTLCDLTGIVSPHETSGKSLAPQLNDVSIPGKAYEMMMLKPHIYAIRTSKYRYTEWRVDPQTTRDSMLYDLENDPNEFNNLAGNPEYKAVMLELKVIMDSR